MSSAMGWFCFQLTGWQDSQPRGWSSASLAHNRSCLPRLFFQFPRCGYYLHWRKFTFFRWGAYVSAIYYKSLKYVCYKASRNSCFRFLSCWQMMNCAIFGQKHADLKYVTDLLAFAHIAPPPLLSFSLSSHQLWHVTWSHIFALHHFVIRLISPRVSNIAHLIKAHWQG